jgi:cold shock CspA family protein
MSLIFAPHTMATNRIEGTLKTWNDDKGYGFIAPANGGQDIFVHISDFPRRGGTPKIGEHLSFEITLNKDGKKKAIRVHRPSRGTVTPSQRYAPSRPERKNNSIFGRIVGASLVALICVSGYRYVDSRKNAFPPESVSAPSIPAASNTRWHCDGRTHCSEMTSCEEAMYFLSNCPSTEMDGDGDGIPCESQWCGN